jgi:hypothetical protein
LTAFSREVKDINVLALLERSAGCSLSNNNGFTIAPWIAFCRGFFSKRRVVRVLHDFGPVCADVSLFAVNIAAFVRNGAVVGILQHQTVSREVVELVLGLLVVFGLDAGRGH